MINVMNAQTAKSGACFVDARRRKKNEEDDDTTDQHNDNDDDNDADGLPWVNWTLATMSMPLLGVEKI